MARVILTFLLVSALFPACGPSLGQAVALSAAPDGTAQIRLSSGHSIAIPKERGQVGISNGQIAPDGTAGWLAEFSVAGVSYPIAGRLILWRAGKIIQRFQTEQSFYSWTFYARGNQVAYHVGSLHGEVKSHCELRDVASGRLIAEWDGDLASDSNRPGWTDGLTH